MMLEMHGFVVEGAEDGLNALATLGRAMAEGQEPGVILMDAQLPGLSGVDLVQALRVHTTARIFAISGSEVGTEIREATDGFLLKPIEVETLLAAMEGETAVEAGAKVAGPEAVDSAPVIDATVLGKLRGLMSAAAVREIYVAVVADLKVRLLSLEAAMASGDEAEVRRIAHAIKGGCGMVGFTAAAEVASRLETSSILGSYAEELVRFRVALGALEGILGGDFPV
jgi:HPt (histidine-containing phosphotransfer) domain-containing protein/CheY-like chemotaxis protein